MQPDIRATPTGGRPPVCLRPAGGLLVLLLLAGCNSAVGTELTRETARAVVTPIVQARFPGVPVAPATDCIIDNASGEELVTLATSAATRDDRAAVQVVGQVAQRPETLRCLGRDALPVILQRL